MAENSSVSDTQALLHSMLQRLNLQTRSASDITHTQPELNSPALQQLSDTTVFHFNGSLNNNQQSTPVSIKSTNSDGTFTEQPPCVTDISQSSAKKSKEEISNSSSGFAKPLNWRFLKHRSTLNRNQTTASYSDISETSKWPWKQKPGRMSDSSSVTSLQSIDSLLPPSPTPDTWSQGSMDRWVDPGHKKWTQRLKERWKERNKVMEKQEMEQNESHILKSNDLPILDNPLSSGYNNTTAASEEICVQNQPIPREPEKATPSPFDDMSNPITSLGSFNLMEEILASKEWTKILSPGLTLDSSCNTHDQGMQLPTVTSQFYHHKQPIQNQWGYTAPNTKMTHSPMFSESLQQDMDTSDHAFGQRHSSDVNMSYGHDSHQSQYLPSAKGSNHLMKMNSTGSPAEIDGPIREQSGNVERGHEEMLPVLDLSYLQHGSSLKKESSISRKRSHWTEKKGLSEQSTSEMGEMEDQVPKLSPASSISSFQNSISHDMESSVSAETVIKRRRMENTRHVRFAEEVTYLPPLVQFDYDEEEEKEQEEDGDNYIGECNESIDDSQEEPTPRSSVPRWIAALKNKTKKSSSLKLPHISSTRFRTRKKHSFI